MDLSWAGGGPTHQVVGLQVQQQHSKLGAGLAQTTHSGLAQAEVGAQPLSSGRGGLQRGWWQGTWWGSNAPPTGRTWVAAGTLAGGRLGVAMWVWVFSLYSGVWGRGREF